MVFCEARVREKRTRSPAIPEEVKHLSRGPSPRPPRGKENDVSPTERSRDIGILQEGEGGGLRLLQVEANAGSQINRRDVVKEKVPAGQARKKVGAASQHKTKGEHARLPQQRSYSEEKKVSVPSQQNNAKRRDS